MLTDEQWRLVEPHIPKSTARTGRPMADRRLMFGAALFLLTSGCPWRALPREFGRWQTAFHHFNRWRREGVFDRLARAMLARVDAAGLIDWSCSVSTAPMYGPPRVPQAPAGRPPARRDAGSCTRPQPRRVRHEDPPPRVCKRGPGACHPDRRAGTRVRLRGGVARRREGASPPTARCPSVRQRL